MSKEDANRPRPGPADRIREALKGLLDRAREGAEELADVLGLHPRPALQPVPVRRPYGGRTGRRMGH